MAESYVTYFEVGKGIIIRSQDELSTGALSKILQIEVLNTATANTWTKLQSNQTANRTILLPDASDTLIGKQTIDILTNKDIDGGTASNSNRFTIPKNTTANLNALTRKQGTIVYDTTDNKLKFDNGVNLVDTGGSGEANTMSNLGIGTGIYAQKVGVDLQIKSLVAGTNVSLSNNANEITINATGGSGEANTSSNMGTGTDGVGLATAKVGVDLPFKRLKAGTNISFTEETNDVIINASTGSGGAVIIAPGGTLSGTYENNVICQGSVTMTGLTFIDGWLYVNGNLTSSTTSSLTVENNLYVAGNLTLDALGANQSAGNLTVGGNLVVQGALSGVGNGTGTTGGNGSDVIIYGNCHVLSHVHLAGGTGSTTGGRGGDFVCVGETFLNSFIEVFGGVGVTGGRGGNIFLGGSASIAMNVNGNGGAGSSTGGNGGSFQSGSSLTVSEIVNPGGSGGTVIGGNGGTVTCNGPVHAVRIATNGGAVSIGGTTATSGNGGNITLNTNSIVDYLESSSGNRHTSSLDGVCGNSGIITVNGGTIIGIITSSGYNIFTSVAGAPGNVILYNTSVSGGLQIRHGGGTVPAIYYSLRLSGFISIGDLWITNTAYSYIKQAIVTTTCVLKIAYISDLNRLTNWVGSLTGVISSAHIYSLSSGTWQVHTGTAA